MSYYLGFMKTIQDFKLTAGLYHRELNDVYQDLTPLWAGSSMAILIPVSYYSASDLTNIESEKFSESLGNLRSSGIIRHGYLDIPVDLEQPYVGSVKRKFGKSDQDMRLVYSPTLGLIDSIVDSYVFIKIIRIINFSSLRWSLEYAMDSVKSSFPYSKEIDLLSLYSACESLFNSIK